MSKYPNIAAIYTEDCDISVASRLESPGEELREALETLEHLIPVCLNENGGYKDEQAYSEIKIAENRVSSLFCARVGVLRWAYFG